jgi:hypothetical protein
MGCFEETCIICGCGLCNWASKDAEYDWLRKYHILTHDTPGLVDGHYDGYGRVHVKDKGQVYFTPGVNTTPALICHDDCYEFLLTHLKYEVKYEHVISRVRGSNCLICPTSIYYPVDSYHSQVFGFRDAMEENDWCIRSPLHNDQNAQRVVGIWKKIAVSN